MCQLEAESVKWSNQGAQMQQPNNRWQTYRPNYEKSCSNRQNSKCCIKAKSAWWYK